MARPLFRVVGKRQLIYKALTGCKSLAFPIYYHIRLYHLGFCCGLSVPMKCVKDKLFVYNKPTECLIEIFKMVLDGECT